MRVSVLLLLVLTLLPACAGPYSRAESAANTLKPALEQVLALLDVNQTLPGAPAALASLESLLYAWGAVAAGDEGAEERFEAALPCAASAVAAASLSARLQGEVAVAQRLEAIGAILTAIGRGLVCAPFPPAAP